MAYERDFPHTYAPFVEQLGSYLATVTDRNRKFVLSRVKKAKLTQRLLRLQQMRNHQSYEFM